MKLLALFMIGLLVVTVGCVKQAPSADVEENVTTTPPWLRSTVTPTSTPSPSPTATPEPTTTPPPTATPTPTATPAPTIEPIIITDAPEWDSYENTSCGYYQYSVPYIQATVITSCQNLCVENNETYRVIECDETINRLYCICD